MRAPISCYIRTLNEERRIAATVRSAFLVADEVVVIDSGSSDATATVAEAAGARVIEQEWLGGGHQKRVGEEACRHDWLLDLDADEVVTEELAEEILGLFQSGTVPAEHVFRVPMLYVDPTGRIWRKARAPRRAKLYDRRQIRVPAHAAWDQFEIPEALRVRRLKGPLLHHAFDDIAHLSRKQTAHEVRRIRHLAAKGGRSVALKVYAGLPYFFFRNYILRRRWREGAYGFMFSLTTAYTHWLRYAMLHEQHLLSTRRTKAR